MKNKKIAVLMGGLSKERDVSLRSGAAVAKALRARGYDVTEVDMGRDLAERLKVIKTEVAFLALHGRYGEDGAVQGLLEILEIPYTGSGLLASAIGMDKELTKRLVAPLGIKTPAWQVIHKATAGAIPSGPCGTRPPAAFSDSPRGLQEPPLPLPVIVKPNREGSTIGIAIVREKKEYEPALRQAFQFDETVLVEEFITGREVTVAVVNGRSLPVLEIVPKSGFYDYTSKYTKGMTEYIVPARIPDDARDDLRKTSEKIWSLLNLSGFARMDFIEDYFLEVNTIPGMTETSLVPKAAAAAGLSFEDLCEEILKGASLKI